MRDPVDHKTELTDLNDDCQLSILQHLNFNSLLCVFRTNTRYKLLASKILKPIIQKSLIDIVLLYPKTNPLTVKKLGLKVENDYIEINNFTIAERFLKNFGYAIQKLKLGGFGEEVYNETKSIYTLVNLYCSKTLREIMLLDYSKNLLDEFTNTFKNVHSLDIKSPLETKRYLNEIFPSLRRLDIRIFTVEYPDSFIDTYKHLEHLRLRTYPFGDFFTKEWGWAAEIIRKNPQIRSLNLERAAPQLLKIVADTMPQLEKLELYNLEKCIYDNETISFGNVKVLTLRVLHLDDFLHNVRFGNVEELTVFNLAMAMFEGTNFFETNKNVKKLRIESRHPTEFKSEEFRQLARITTTLQDVFITNVRGFDLARFSQFITNNKQLKKFHMIFYDLRTMKVLLNVIREVTSDAWSMGEFGDTIILTKKNALL